MANKLPITALLVMLQRIKDREQLFYLGTVSETDDSMAFRYKLLEIFADGKTYFIHVKGYYIGTGYRSNRGELYEDERMVNLAHVVSIKPINQTSSRPAA